MYGREPPSLIAATPSARTPPKIAELILERGELLATLRQNLTQAQQRMRDTANRHRRHVEFEVGEFVWLKLQPYRQHSVAHPLSAKLSRRYYGPFEILERIGPVAYRLRLPEGSRIHNVFHVSLLREFIADSKDEHVPLPPEFCGGRPITQPSAIMDSRAVWHDGKAVDEVLVSWSDASPLSWEPAERVRQQFPALHLEDKVSFIRGELIRTCNRRPGKMTLTSRC